MSNSSLLDEHLRMLRLQLFSRTIIVLPPTTAKRFGFCKSWPPSKLIDDMRMESAIVSPRLVSP
jgi:hypothetical protein